MKILDEIEGFLTETGMNANSFGLYAVNDGKLVERLRSGGDVTTRNADKLAEFMESERKRRKGTAT